MAGKAGDMAESPPALLPARAWQGQGEHGRGKGEHGKGKGEHGKGKGEHGRGKPCHYYTRSEAVPAWYSSGTPCGCHASLADAM